MLQWRSATAAITVVTIVVSALALLWNIGLAATVWGFTPALVGVPLSHELAIPWWLTPLTSALLHGSWPHLAMNMLILVFLGSQVERIVGSAGLVVAYVVGALAAAAAQYALGPMSVIPMIGASGAISAVLGLYALCFGRPKRVSENMKLNRWVHVAWLLVAWVVLQWMTTYLMGMQGVMIATGAHVGGFIAGVVLQKPLLLWRYRKA